MSKTSSAIFKIKSRKVYAFIMPGFLLFVFSLILPIFISFYISMTNWVGGPKMTFIGLKNYIDLIADEKFWNSFLNNLKFIGILLVSQIGLAFIFAMFIQSKLIYFKELHRRLIFLPAVLAPIVVGMIWQIVYNMDYGMIASIMKAVGLGDHLIPWLDDPNLVIPSIAIVLTWQYVGQFVLIIMAGMQNINTTILESAEIDGAKSVKKAVYIVFPLLKPALSVCVLMVVSGCMKMFAIVYAISGGGPGRASQLTALYAYDTAFKVQQLGYSSAISVGMVILSLGLIVISQTGLKLLGGNDE